MFGIALLAALVLGGGYIVVTEVNKATWQKLQLGDIAMVPFERLSVGNPTDDAALKTFLAGFVTQVVKVQNVVVDAAKGLGHGTVLGFPATVSFPLETIASIDRNGMRIV